MSEFVTGGPVTAARVSPTGGYRFVAPSGEVRQTQLAGNRPGTNSIFTTDPALPRMHHEIVCVTPHCRCRAYRSDVARLQTLFRAIADNDVLRDVLAVSVTDTEITITLRDSADLAEGLKTLLAAEMAKPEVSSHRCAELVGEIRQLQAQIAKMAGTLDPEMQTAKSMATRRRGELEVAPPWCIARSARTRRCATT